MTDTRQQIAWLRGLGGDGDGYAAGVADKIERLQAQNESLTAAEAVLQYENELLEKVAGAAKDYIENYGNGSKKDYERKILLGLQLAALKEQI